MESAPFTKQSIHSPIYNVPQAFTVFLFVEDPVSGLFAVLLISFPSTALVLPIFLTVTFEEVLISDKGNAPTKTNKKLSHYFLITGQ